MVIVVFVPLIYCVVNQAQIDSNLFIIVTNYRTNTNKVNKIVKTNAHIAYLPLDNTRSYEVISSVYKNPIAEIKGTQLR